jgi:predicted dehydrogenase
MLHDICGNIEDWSPFNQRSFQISRNLDSVFKAASALLTENKILAQYFSHVRLVYNELWYFKTHRRWVMKDIVRVGIVGTSGYTAWIHLPNLQSHKQVQISAICGRNQEVAAEVAKQFGIPRVYGDYNQMIEAGGLDAVVVATPDHLHYPITMAALNAGLHVLCEKPLAQTAQQAKEMLDAAENRGLVHMTMFTWRWVPHYRQICELVSGGYLGRIQSVSLRWPMSFGIASTYMWRTDAAYGNGVLGDLGSHIFDLARLFAGDIRRVSAHLTTRIDRPHPDGESYKAAFDTATLLLEFDSGAQGTVELTYAAILGEGARASTKLSCKVRKQPSALTPAYRPAILLARATDDKRLRPCR